MMRGTSMVSMAAALLSSALPDRGLFHNQVKERESPPKRARAYKPEPLAPPRKKKSYKGSKAAKRASRR